MQIKFYFLEISPVHFLLIIQKMSLPKKKIILQQKIQWRPNLERLQMCIDDPSYMMEIQSKAPQRSDGGARVRSFCPQIQTRLGSLCLILSHPQEIRQDFLQWLKYEININILDVDYFIGDGMERYLECVREVWSGLGRWFWEAG